MGQLSLLLPCHRSLSVSSGGGLLHNPPWGQAEGYRDALVSHSVLLQQLREVSPCEPVCLCVPCESARDLRHVRAKGLSSKRLLQWPLEWAETTVVSLGPSAPLPVPACCLLLRIQK